MSWVFENVGMAIVTMVTIEKEYCHSLTKLNISRNTLPWVFENVFILIASIVMTDLMTLVK